MAQLSPDDRALLTAHLTRTRDVLMGEVAHLGPAQWTFRPGEEIWSIADCADHVATIERRIFSMVSKHMQGLPPNPERGAEVQKKTPWILEAVPSRVQRVKVPPDIANHRHFETPEEFIDVFQERRELLLSYVRETQDPMHDRVMPHPVFKDLDACQWILMISLHSERHAAQIAEVKGHPAYPK